MSAGTIMANWCECRQHLLSGFKAPQEGTHVWNYKTGKNLWLEVIGSGGESTIVLLNEQTCPQNTCVSYPQVTAALLSAVSGS